MFLNKTLLMLKKRTSLIFVFAIGLIIGLSISQINNSKTTEITESRSGGFELINPLYECNSDEVIGHKEYGDLEGNLNNYINDQKSNPNITNINDISVYFRDLNNGPWIGINEKDAFSPASLLKLPIAITYLKLSESNPSILDKKIKFEVTKYDSYDQLLEPKEKIITGNEYTVDELIKRMLIYSDNEALGLLKNNIDEKEIADAYKELGIALNKDDLTTVRSYSSIYRMLYNSSYLNIDNSIKLLDLLTHVDFQDGLRKPIPDSIKIANKFGERGVRGNSNIQLHDCGIIYLPKHPYLLCIMTKGSDIEKQKTIIQTISEIVYGENTEKYDNK